MIEDSRKEFIERMFVEASEEVGHGENLPTNWCSSEKE